MMLVTDSERGPHVSVQSLLQVHLQWGANQDEVRPNHLVYMSEMGSNCEAVPAPQEGPFSPKMKTENACCILGA